MGSRHTEVDESFLGFFYHLLLYAFEVFKRLNTLTS